jgi:hypothetical protein
MGGFPSELGLARAASDWLASLTRAAEHRPDAWMPAFALPLQKHDLVVWVAEGTMDPQRVHLLDIQIRRPLPR